MVLDIRQMPLAFEEWREINVRDPKLNSWVAREIEKTLIDEPESFFFKNRGLTIIVDKVRYDNKNNIVEMELFDKQISGLLDGGHTFSVIRNYLKDLSSTELEDINAYVKVEILEGVQDYEKVVSIVKARNTSTQVKEQGILELLKQYEEIKKVINSLSYANRISYKEHELLEDGSSKDIDIKEILSYLICFDVEEFNDNKHPIKAYSTKSSVLNHFRDNHKRLIKYISLLPKILELRDTIYSELPGAYNNSTGGKFGRLTGVIEVSNRRMNKTKLPFSEIETSYRIPSGFIYPILASFRNLIDLKKDQCGWKIDPIKFFRKLKKELSVRVGEQAKELRNPNKLGKDNATWGRCYDLVKLEVLKRGL